MYKHVIKGFVDIWGDSVIRHFNGYVDIINESSIAEEIVPKNNIPNVFNGTLKDGDTLVSNARVSLIKNNIIVDYCMTDINGEYTLFAKNGMYTMKINNSSINMEFQNEEITSDNGLVNEYYYSINNKTSLIKKRYDDIIEFHGTTKKLISGIMLDNNKYPIENAEIIISQDKNIVSYIITDNMGKYSFALDNGIYDIRIRFKKQPVKIINNFEFKDGRGFMFELQKQSNLFRRDNSLWIYN